MLTEDQIIKAAIERFSQTGSYYPIAIGGFKLGAAWANEQNAKEIEELKRIIAGLEKDLAFWQKER